MKRKQSGFKIMMRLIKLVKPLAGFMLLAILLGVTGFLCVNSNHNARQYDIAYRQQE